MGRKRMVTAQGQTPRIVGRPGPGLLRVQTPDDGERLFSQVRRPGGNARRIPEGKTQRSSVNCLLCGKAIPTSGERYYRDPIAINRVLGTARICEACGTATQE